MDDRSFEDRFARWLTEACGLAEPRRIVRRTSDRILVSKFEDGFAARLHELLARIPELADEVALGSAYDAAANEGESVTRVEAWRRAVTGLVDSLGPERGLDRDQIAEISAGTDSVAALLDTILWSSPRTGEPFEPAPGERAAFADALERMDAQAGLFTRYYGTFEGARVENTCPGAALARVLLASAWDICTAAS